MKRWAIKFYASKSGKANINDEHEHCSGQPVSVIDEKYQKVETPPFGASKTFRRCVSCIRQST